MGEVASQDNPGQAAQLGVMLADSGCDRSSKFPQIPADQG